MGVVLEEADETLFWLELLGENGNTRFGTPSTLPRGGKRARVDFLGLSSDIDSAPPQDGTGSTDFPMNR